VGCLSTYAGLCIYSPDLSPKAISDVLGVQPTRAVERDPTSSKPGKKAHNFWLWSTEELVESTDNLDHLREIFAVFRERSESLAKLREAGVTMTISVYWDSNGQGGPTLDAPTIAELHHLGVDIWWDVYFVSEDDENGV